MHSAFQVVWIFVRIEAPRIFYASSEPEFFGHGGALPENLKNLGKVVGVTDEADGFLAPCPLDQDVSPPLADLCA